MPTFDMMLILWQIVLATRNFNIDNVTEKKNKHGEEQDNQTFTNVR